jgi:beta-lactamase regulating signal transducer with metallopeptidase domain
MSFIALHLWQSTLMLIAAWVLARACERNGAAVRYWIWFAASVKFLVPFAFLQWLGEYFGRTLPEPLPVDSALIETGKAIFVPAVPGFAAIPDGVLPQIQTVFATIWTLGSATLLLRWFLQWWAIHSTLQSASQISMDLPVPVCVTSRDLTPGVFGVFRPVVVLPRGVMQALNSEQMQTVLAHEACHVRRHDNLTAAIHKCVEVVFWFHPLVWWIGANLLREREAACDESVVEQGHRRTVYAESILQVCRLSVAAKFSGMAASTGGDLARRMSSIMSEHRALPIGHARFLLLLSMAIVACYAPIAAGIIAGAVREASHSGPITFDAVTLELSQPRWWHSREFDPEGRRLALKDVSLRDLISLAYPSSTVNSAPDLIDRTRYDIEARWHDQGVTSERSVYRQLLGKILRSNSNLQIHVNYQCDTGCS